MSDNCCSNSNWQRAVCPRCGTECKEVPLQTMEHHIHAPWRSVPPPGEYYFCDNRDCEIVYFDRDGLRYTRITMRPETRTALANDMICFCYGIDRATAEEEPQCREFVIEQTRNKACACESRNPSGRCCLKDFPD